jgi:hypothetical protein
MSAIDRSKVAIRIDEHCSHNKKKSKLSAPTSILAMQDHIFHIFPMPSSPCGPTVTSYTRRRPLKIFKALLIACLQCLLKLLTLPFIAYRFLILATDVFYEVSNTSSVSKSPSTVITDQRLHSAPRERGSTTFEG